MFVVRPVNSSDLDAFMELIEQSGPGLTSLPKDKDIIQKKIALSEQSYQKRKDKSHNGSYLFVMEDTVTKKIVGVCGIIAKLGSDDPFYYYLIEENNTSSSMLNVQKKLKTIKVTKTTSGPSEICSLFLSSHARKSLSGRLLSLSRFLFIAKEKESFQDTVIAQMRGKVDDDGNSCFWDAVGRKFMDIEFNKADYLYMKDKQFIEDLLPKTPLFIDLLPEDAQEEIAQVNEKTEPAKRILEKEGFCVSSKIGIFEGGAILEAQTENIRTIKNSHLAKVKSLTEKQSNETPYLIATASDDLPFKAVIGDITVSGDNEVSLSLDIAKALGVTEGKDIRYVALKST